MPGDNVGDTIQSFNKPRKVGCMCQEVLAMALNAESTTMNTSDKFSYSHGSYVKEFFQRGFVCYRKKIQYVLVKEFSEKSA